jgi:alpha-ketoglutarate-dependent taurine dioxygenase
MSAVLAKARIAADRESLILEWAGGGTTEFASLWLRDNCEADRDRHSGQRLRDIAELPWAPRLRSADALGDVVEIRWQDEPAAARFAVQWLAQQAHEQESPERVPAPWLDGAARNALRDFAWATLHELSQDPRAKLRWLTRLLQVGIAFLRDVPLTDTGIVEAMTSVGQLCETNYGRVFDVRAVARPENLAYSDRGLGLHTDNPYREPVPGFQALHTLQAAPDGGESLFADGFALAEHLRRVDADSFALLTRTKVPFRYRSADAELYAERPFIELTCDGAIAAVHYNNRSIAPLLERGRAGSAFYAAYRRFAELLQRSDFQLRYKLNEGDLVLFDNRRILHGRTAFASAAHGRHLRGCYLTRDSVFGTTARLRRQLLGDHPDELA